MLGLGLSLTGLSVRRGGGVSPFVPSDVGLPVYTWDIQDVASLYVERTGGGTTPATVGDPVGTIREQWGSTFHAVAPTDAARGTLRQTAGGKYYLETDGTADCYQIENFPLSNRFSIHVGFKQVANTKPLFIEHSANFNSNDGFLFYGTSPGSLGVRRGTVHSVPGQTNWGGSDLAIADCAYLTGVTPYYTRNGRTMLTGTITGTQAAVSTVTTTLNLFSRNKASLFSELGCRVLSIVDGDISAADIRKMRAWTMGKTAKYLYVAEGDSITENPGLPTSYARLKWAEFQAANPQDAAWSMQATGSAGLATLRSREAAISSLCNGGGADINIFSVLIGAGNSDLIGYTGVLGDGYDGWLADLAAICDNRRADGYKVIVGTVLPKQYGTGEWTAARAYVNPILRTWPGVHCDAIADFAAHPIMGPEGAEDDATLYGDHVHPTALGQGYLLDVFSPVFDAVVA